MKEHMTINRSKLFLGVLLATSLSLSACTPGAGLAPTAPTSQAGTNAGTNLSEPATSVFPTNLPQQPLAPNGNPLPAAGGDLIANNSGSLGSSGGRGGSLIANNSAQLTGVVKAPSTLIANNSGSLIANNSGSLIANNSGSLLANNSGSYRVLAEGDEGVLANMIVTLRKADGTYVKDSNGNIVTALTDSQGRYTITYPVNNSENLMVHVLLQKNDETKTVIGDLLGFVPKGGGGTRRGVDLNTHSSLVLSYIMTEYVKNEQAILDRLTADLEAETRTKLAANGGVDVATLEELTPSKAEEVVTAARTNDVVDAQLEEVKRRLIIGLPNQGNGQPANTIETDAMNSVAVSAFGEVYFIGRGTNSIWKKALDGNLYRVAGTGTALDSSLLDPTAAAPGDGQLATEPTVSFRPVGMAFQKTGVLYVLDETHRRVRKVDENGVITTFAANANFRELRGIAFEPEGSLVVATHCALYRISKDGQTITLIAGVADRMVNNASPEALNAVMAPTATRFTNLEALAVDPRNGNIFVYDTTGRVRLFAKAAGYAEVTLSLPRSLGGKLGYKGALAVDNDGGLLIADAAQFGIYKVNLNNQTFSLVTGTPGKLGIKDGQPLVGLVLGLSVHENGEIYFSDTGLVRKVPSSAPGVPTTVVGTIKSDPGVLPADQVQFSYPSRILFEPNKGPKGSLLIGDSFRLRRLDLATDNVTLVASNGPVGDNLTGDGKTSSFTVFGAMAKVPANAYGPGSPEAIVYHAADNTGSYRMLQQVEVAPTVNPITTIAGGNLNTWKGSAAGDGDFYWNSQYAGTPALAVGAPLSSYHIFWDMAYAGDGFFTTLISTLGVTEATRGGLFKVVPDPTDPTNAAKNKMIHLFGPTFDPDPTDANPALPIPPMSALAVRPKAGAPTVRELYVGYLGGIAKVELDAQGFPVTVGGAPALQPVAGRFLMDPNYGFYASSPFTLPFQLPGAIIFDAQGRLVFSDPLTHRIIRVGATPWDPANPVANLSTIAGVGTAVFGGDAVDNGFSNPMGLAFDADGNLFVADLEHHQIKKVEAAQIAP